MIPNREGRKAKIFGHKWPKSKGCKAKPERCQVKSKGREAKSDGQQQLWHYLAVKRLSVLLRTITSKNYDIYFLNCLHSFRIKNKS